MIDSLKMGKRAITVAVAATTILWSIGISSFVAPLTARAATAGDVIKGTTLSTLYYYGSDGSRYAFPNEKTYFTWYSDFSDVETISDSELAAIPLAGNIVYRAGSRWVKITTAPQTYVVTPEGQIRWIEDAEIAEALAGSDWNTMIDDVPDTFFVDYTVGTSIDDAGDAYNGALVDVDGTTYLVWDGEKREVTSAGFSANRFQTRNVLDGAGMDLSGLDAGDDVTSELSDASDSAQLGGVEVTGGLSVSLASDTPASSTIPAGASSVGFTKVKLVASSGSAEVSQMVFHAGGLGDTSDVENTYLYEGSVRLTDGRSINSSRNVTFSGLDISLDSGDSTYVTVKSDVSTTPAGGDEMYFELASASAVTSTATVSGSFPVKGNTMTFSETDAGTLTITGGTDPSDPTIGEEGAEIAEFDLEATDEDAWLEEISVNVDDSSDHDNYKLWSGNDELATGTVSGDLVTFVLVDSFLVEEDNSETLNITADVGGESGDTITTYIEEAADVVAMGGDYGFNLAINIDDYDAVADASVVTVEGGDLTFAFNGPTSDDIVVDGNDVVFMEFSLTASNWTEVKEIGVIVEDDGEDNDSNDDTGLKGDGTSADYANLEDIAIRKSDGSIWMDSMELGFDTADSDTTQTLSFDDNQIMQAGESLDLMVTADISADAVASEVYHVELDLSAAETDGWAEDANGDALTDIVPSADIVGNDMTVTASSLSMTLSKPPSTATFVKGATSASVVGFMFEAGDASDVTVNEVNLTVEGDDDGTWTDGTNDIDVASYVSSCSAYDNESGSLIDGPVSPDDSDDGEDEATLTFDSMDWTIEAGESAKLIVKCNFSNQNSSSNSDAYVFYMESTADAEDSLVDAEDADGEDVTVSEITEANGNDPTGAESVVITVTTGGTMTVTASSATPKSTIILGSSTGVNVSALKFAATNQAFVVNTFSLYNCVGWYADLDVDCTGAGESLGDDDATSSVKVTYTDSDGETATDTGYLTNNVVTFDGLDLYVPADDNTTVTISVDTNSVTSSTASSGDQIQLNFIDDNFDADGVGSSNSLDDGDVDDAYAVNDMTLRKTKPTLSLASGSPAGSGIPGYSEVFRFNVAADSRGDLTLDKVVFQVSTSDSDNDFNLCSNLASATKWELYDLDDPSTKLDDASDWTWLDSGVGDAAEDCDAANVIAFAVLDFTGSSTTLSEEIGAGETKTYVLKADTANASASDDDSIRIDIPDEATVDASDAFIDSNDEAIQWDDEETTGNDATGDDENISGDLVKNLAITGGQVQY